MLTWTVAGVALTSIAIISVFWWTGQPQPAAVAQSTSLPSTDQPSPVLGLAAQVSGHDIVITWRATGIVDPVHSSSLYINDGARRTHILLEPSQLTIGRIVYSPQFANVAVELQIATVGDKLVRESIMIDAARQQQTTPAGVVSPLPIRRSPELRKEDSGVKLPKTTGP
jgi:hypothetical protein